MKNILLLLIVSGNLNAQHDSGAIAKGAYLGQDPPGQKAELFAKGIISTEKYEHSSPAFSPDGKLVIWGVVERDKPSYLLEMFHENGSWSAPAILSFGDSLHDNMYPRFSPDGKILYFSSRRPLPPGYPTLIDIRIWFVKRTSVGWGQPKPLDIRGLEGTEYAHSVAMSGNIYYSYRKENGKIFDIGLFRKTKKGYVKDSLPDGVNSEYTEDGPCVSPDESFLIFESSRPGGFGSNDLYVCFKQEDGNWAPPKNLGPAINTAFSERFAGLSPDGKYLFFGSDRRGNSDIFWISSDVIYKLK